MTRGRVLSANRLTGGRRQMKTRVLGAALAITPLWAAQSQTRPLVDHHQHFFSPAAAALVSPAPLPRVDLPADLDTLIQARGRDGQNAAALRELFTDDVWVVHFSRAGFIRGRDSVVVWLIRTTRAPARLTPIGSSVSGSSGQVAAYVTEGWG